MAVATEFATLSLGDVEVDPVESIVVVPGETAVIVGWPAPVIQTKFNCVPIAYGTLALVGTVTEIAEALFKVIRELTSAETGV